MGVLSKLFGKKDKVEISVIDSSQDNFDSPTSQLLKDATQKKKNGDLPGAIECLKSAYKIMCDDPEWFSAEGACRLPMYLNLNKQNQEAWDTFLDIIKRSDRYSFSTVYGKMRLFLQRTGKPLEAVKYGVFSYLADMANGYLNNEEAKEYGGSPVQTISKMPMEEIEKLLKKAKRPELATEIKIIADKYFKQIPDINFVELSKELDMHSK